MGQASRQPLVKIRVSVLVWGLVAGVSAGAMAPAGANPADGLALNLAPLADVVGKPPLQGSDRLKRDLAVLRWQQFARDSELVGHAWSYLGREIGRFQAAIGSDFEKTAPRIGAGLPRFVHLVDKAKNQLKVAHNRSRPFLTHPDLKPCLPLESS